MTHLKGIWERGGGQNGDKGGCHWCSHTCRGCWRGVEVRMEMMGNVIGGAGELVMHLLGMLPGHTHTRTHMHIHEYVHTSPSPQHPHSDCCSFLVS